MRTDAPASPQFISSCEPGEHVFFSPERMSDIPFCCLEYSVAILRAERKDFWELLRSIAEIYSLRSRAVAMTDAFSFSPYTGVVETKQRLLMVSAL